MGRLIASTQITLDGVIDSPVDWYIPEGEHEVAGEEQLLSADALLLGRKTFEGFREVWPPLISEHGYGERMNSITKYVASRTLSGPLDWGGELLPGDAVQAVRDLKERLPGDLQIYGLGSFAYDLATAGLIDELRLYVHPVMWGEGVRLFDGKAPLHVDLVASATYRSGVVRLDYTVRSTPDSR